MSQSSRVPNVRTQRPGSASTARSGSNPPPWRVSAAASSRVIAPLPVQPSTNTTVRGSWCSARYAQRHRVDAAPAHDRHRVVRQVQAVTQGRPAAQQDPDGGAGPGQRDQHDVVAALGEHQLRDGADGSGQPRRGRGQRRSEQLQVGRVGLVLPRQRLGVVRAAVLHRLLTLLRGRLQGDPGQVGEQPAHLVGCVAAETGAAQRWRCHGVITTVVRRVCGASAASSPVRSAGVSAGGSTTTRTWSHGGAPSTGAML